MTDNAADDPLLRVCQRDAATAQVLSYLLLMHGGGQPFEWSTKAVEAATGLRGSLVPAAMGLLVNLGLLKFSHGRKVRLRVQEIAQRVRHPELPPPAPLFPKPLPRGTRAWEGRRGDAPTADDRLALLLHAGLDKTERDLRSLEEKSLPPIETAPNRDDDQPATPEGDQ